jgi:hypothetical protein
MSPIRRYVPSLFFLGSIDDGKYDRYVPREHGSTYISPTYTDFKTDQALHEDDTLQPGVAEDILFLVSQSVLYACTDAVRSLDQ